MYDILNAKKKCTETGKVEATVSSVTSKTKQADVEVEGRDSLPTLHTDTCALRQ